MGRVVLIGSNNPDKAVELRELLRDTPWEVKTLAEFHALAEPKETESTFAGNALLKARYYAGRLGVACVADDSGLEADALEGAPGVYSARYAGRDCTYDDNNRKLLTALAGVPEAERTARFVCCAALVDGQGREHVECGTVEGRIAPECRGTHGFGYDPLFIPQGFEQTFGEMDPEAKSRISHRGRAFRKLREHLAAIA